MNIILGHEFDTGSYPDALGNEKATLGNVVVGPDGGLLFRASVNKTQN